MNSTAIVLPPRWETLRRHDAQIQYATSRTRFNVVPAGRRSGKTEIAKRRLVLAAMRGTSFRSPRFFAAAPTLQQAKRIYWDDLKLLVPPWMIRGKPRETDLVIHLHNGASIWVCGLDRPERIEGQPWDGGILDEYANMKSTAWPANVRPALSDRNGWCDLIGVPEGRNHYYDRYRYAMDSGDPEWMAHHWMSADILPAKEIGSARRDLDPQTFQQEYEASFLYYSGRAYYQFDEREHCTNLDYDPSKPLIFCFDFNVDPGVAVVCQEIDIGGYQGTGVIGEVYIPTNSNTPAVCDKLFNDWSGHQGRILVYGDATGGSRGTAQTQGSDWDLIKSHLNSAFRKKIYVNVPLANPSERSRLNAMNTRLKSRDGLVKMRIDPRRAPNLVKDFEGVVLLEGGSGQIDKKKTPKLTHLTDALGYYVVKEYPTSADIRSISSHKNRMA